MEKKTFTHVAYALGIAMAIIPSAALKAQTTFKLAIGGQTVTTQNANDIKGEFLKGGKITYDKASHTLTLNNAIIDTYTMADDNLKGIESGLPNLTIKLIGKNKIHTYYASGIYNNSKCTMTIVGDTLNVESAQQSAIFSSEESLLKIIDCAITAKGLWGIGGITGLKDEKLYVENATVSAFGRYASVSSFASIEMKNCKIVAPTQAVWNTDYHAVCEGKKIVANKEVKIAPEGTNGIKPTYNNSNTKEHIYNINGQKQNVPHHGLNIVKTSYGKVKKIIVR